MAHKDPVSPPLRHVTANLGLAQALAHNRVLRTLGVSVNRLQAGGALVLLGAIGPKQRVATLNLGSNEMLGEGAEYVARAIRNVPALTALELEGNNFGPLGAEVIGVAAAAIWSAVPVPHWGLTRLDQELALYSFPENLAG